MSLFTCQLIMINRGINVIPRLICLISLNEGDFFVEKEVRYENLI